MNLTLNLLDNNKIKFCLNFGVMNTIIQADLYLAVIQISSEQQSEI